MSLECPKCGAPMQFQSARFPSAGLWCPTCEAPCEMCGKPGAGPRLTDDPHGRDCVLPLKILCVSCAKDVAVANSVSVERELDGVTYRQPPRSEVDLLREENAELRRKIEVARIRGNWWVCAALAWIGATLVHVIGGWF